MLVPDELLEEVARCSTTYARARCRDARAITAPDVLRFFAIVMYMGVYRFPSKTDHWDGYLAPLPRDIIAGGGMSKTKFQYLWRNIQFEGVDDSDVGESTHSTDCYPTSYR